MKLKLMIKDVPAGKKLLLCDEAGEPLPEQFAVSIDNEIDSILSVTVSFYIDGEQIAFA